MDFRGFESRIAVPVAQLARRHHLQLRGSAAAAAAASAASAAASAASASASAAAAAAAGAFRGRSSCSSIGIEDEITPQAAAILDNAAAAYQPMRPGSGRARRSRRPFGLRPTTMSACRSVAPTTSAAIWPAAAFPTASITTEAFGESRPLVETADGVREPQNRRVEITFGPGSGW